MNRDQKAAAIAEIAEDIRGAQAVFAVDYRGLSVTQAAELRGRLRDADARFRVVKNTLTQIAADQAEAEALKELLEGPTALTFVRGDVAAAAKALADYGRETELIPFKGGLMEGNAVSSDDIRAIARLPARQVLYGQLVGLVASPITGLARTLNALIGGLAIQLGQIHEQELVPRGAGAAAAPADEPAAAAPAEAGTEPTDADAVETPEAQAAAGEAPQGPPGGGSEETAGEGADPDAGPAGAPEPAQPDQAEGPADPDKTE